MFSIEVGYNNVMNTEYRAPSTEHPKKFILDMFPYPSGATMHVGHLEGYVGTDIISRYLRMKGFSVLHPMGWDAFGLPAENYAIKTGIHPDKSTHENINTFKRQLIASELSYDWEHELDTSGPEYYRWTQWLFIQLFKRGLAYKKKSFANWCPKDETVLADEQVVDGKCERCEAIVVKKELDQWFFKITDYADRLIEDLDKLDWLDEVKAQQINWVGRKNGHIVKFGDLEVFTTRIDTLNNVTFIAVSDKKDGYSVPHPITGKKIPVYHADYVLNEYGTGAVMGVPAYDERDRDFANKHQIDILDNGLDGSLSKYGTPAKFYHLRDWLVSRQRYWGAPIPMIYCTKCNWQPVPEKDLPVLLPTDPSPLARSKTFGENVVCPVCGGSGQRETDTMDGFVDNSWYFIRFTDPKNAQEFVSQKAAKTWLPVDLYVGGGHVVQHLLYARFFWKVLIDAGFLDKSLGEEPFLKLRAPGWILGPDSRKMSKRWGNVITPDEIINKYGADTLRMYEMFMGPFSAMKPWSITGVEGISRFLSRLKRKFEQGYVSPNIDKLVAQVTKDIEDMSFNTAISSMMKSLNEMIKPDTENRVPSTEYQTTWTKFIKVLAPFAPQLAEEMWNKMGHTTSVHLESWPTYSTKVSETEKVTIVVQIDGKVRGRLQTDIKTAKSEMLIKQMALESDKTGMLNKNPDYRTIFVPCKLINFFC